MTVGLNSTATDACSTPTFVETRVFSDEANLAAGMPAATTPDATLAGGGLPSSILRLRAERRSGPGGVLGNTANPLNDGRVYLILVRWTDGTNQGFKSRTVICPISLTPSKLTSALAQATAASAVADTTNAAPAGFVQLVP